MCPRLWTGRIDCPMALRAGPDGNPNCRFISSQLGRDYGDCAPCHLRQAFFFEPYPAVRLPQTASFILQYDVLKEHCEQARRTSVFDACARICQYTLSRERMFTFATAATTAIVRCCVPPTGCRDCIDARGCSSCVRMPLTRTCRIRGSGTLVRWRGKRGRYRMTTAARVALASKETICATLPHTRSGFSS